MIELPMTCDGCGAVCCRHMGYPPFLVLWDDREFDALPPALQGEVRLAMLARRGDSGLPCIWLDGERCRHHDLRPSVCRDFTVGGEDCLASRHKARIENSTERMNRW